MTSQATREALVREYYNQLGGDANPCVWVSLFKALPGRWKWWQGWRPNLTTDVVYADDESDVPLRNAVFSLRKPPPVRHVEGHNRALSRITLRGNSIDFEHVIMKVTAGTYIAIGLRRRRDDAEPFDVTEMMFPKHLSVDGELVVTPSYYQS